jgi:hypothetical protein
MLSFPISGHGQKHLASLLAAMNILVFLLPSGGDQSFTRSGADS